MVLYNRERFIFQFDPETKLLSEIYDSKYEASYNLKHPAFDEVFKIAVNSLSTEAAELLLDRVKEEKKYVRVISGILYNRKKSE